MSIYKYVIAERIDVLRNGRIRFSQLSALNDPIEMQPFFGALFEDSTMREIFEETLDDAMWEKGLRQAYDERPLEQASLSFDEFYGSAQERLDAAWEKAFRQQLRQEYDDRPPEFASLSFDEFYQAVKDDSPPEFASLSLDEFYQAVKQEFGPNLKHMLRQEVIGQSIASFKSEGAMAAARQQPFKEIDENFGVLSLTEKPDNLLMWAHYAGQHQGFVIEFDESHPYFDQKQLPEDALNYLRKVKYSVDRPNKTLVDLTDEDWFLTKGKDWEYEQEWRMLRKLKDSDARISVPGCDVHLFSFPPECVKGIILGARTPDQHKTEIMNLINNDARYNHVKVYQAIIDDRRFQLNIQPFSPTPKSKPRKPRKKKVR